uniref:Uncharacterized protein n=1 Tax=Rangifer tarandus platyrhynchus TaxID=3082113 RepID=A0ACB0F3G1_RANTA|nr:unnamed protein product [Rangifer tarandus platyrhynchus]
MKPGAVGSLSSLPQKRNSACEGSSAPPEQLPQNVLQALLGEAQELRGTVERGWVLGASASASLSALSKDPYREPRVLPSTPARPYVEFIIVNILKAFRPDLVPPGTGAEPQAGTSSEQDMPLGPKGDPRPVGMLLLIAGPNREGRAGRPVGARSACPLFTDGEMEVLAEKVNFSPNKRRRSNAPAKPQIPSGLELTFTQDTKSGVQSHQVAAQVLGPVGVPAGAPAATIRTTGHGDLRDDGAPTQALPCVGSKAGPSHTRPWTGLAASPERGADTPAPESRAARRKAI